MTPRMPSRDPAGRPITVVKVTRSNRAALLADPDFVWVGRWPTRLGMRRSIWGNPWKVSEHGTAAEVV